MIICVMHPISCLAYRRQIIISWSVWKDFREKDEADLFAVDEGL